MNAYRTPARIIVDAAPYHSRAGIVSAIFLWVVSLGFTLFAGGWVVATSIFSSPDVLSAGPLVPAFLAAIGAWNGWSHNHARSLRFDAADTIFKLLVGGTVLFAGFILFIYVHGILYPPPPLTFGFGLGGC